MRELGMNVVLGGLDDLALLTEEATRSEIVLSMVLLFTS
jgi:hypothetical protein